MSPRVRKATRKEQETPQPKKSGRRWTEYENNIVLKSGLNSKEAHQLLPHRTVAAITQQRSALRHRQLSSSLSSSDDGSSNSVSRNLLNQSRETPVTPYVVPTCQPPTSTEPPINPRATEGYMTLRSQPRPAPPSPSLQRVLRWARRTGATPQASRPSLIVKLPLRIPQDTSSSPSLSTGSSAAGLGLGIANLAPDSRGVGESYPTVPTTSSHQGEDPIPVYSAAAENSHTMSTPTFSQPLSMTVSPSGEVQDRETLSPTRSVTPSDLDEELARYESEQMLRNNAWERECAQRLSQMFERKREIDEDGQNVVRQKWKKTRREQSDLQEQKNILDGLYQILLEEQNEMTLDHQRDVQVAKDEARRENLALKKVIWDQEEKIKELSDENNALKVELAKKTELIKTELTEMVMGYFSSQMQHQV